ncbi:MAG: chromosomal replication initiator protein DnaA, partial [Bacilli bacterium]|nr:chromosomal replication initiator protein DnaA [Bacilli bacterium]
TNNNMVIEIGNQYKKNYIKDYYADLIEEVLEIVTNANYTFELVTEEDLIKENEKKDKELDLVSNNELPKFKDTVSNLNQKYTFENFVLGDSNRFAQTVALSVAEQPGKLYNPLFIYGKSGLGKTHLMHAIGNFIKETSNKSVLYVRSEEFINDFTQINRKGEDNIDLIQHFKDKYRNIDVLIIEDIQLFRTASQSQIEFFNTFNSLHDKGKQIVISSDSSPDDMKYLEDRLKTRFAWGLQANIMPPDYELKVNILKNKMLGTEVSTLIKPEVLDYIANNCENDVRHLEGIVNRLLILTSMYLPKEINLEFAQENLKDYFGSSLYITNSVAKVQKAVAEYFNLTVENLKSKKRTADINNARQIAMYICKMTTEETIERIGLEFNRNHATVIHACDKIEEEIKNSDNLKSQIIEIKAKINN